MDVVLMIDSVVRDHERHKGESNAVLAAEKLRQRIGAGSSAVNKSKDCLPLFAGSRAFRGLEPL